MTMRVRPALALLCAIVALLAVENPAGALVLPAALAAGGAPHG
jgi:hypothetical protein